MIEVRIRRSSEGSARHLCTWPVTELDSLIPTLEAWGVQDENADFAGEFVLDSDAAYFEVVVNDEDDEVSS